MRLVLAHCFEALLEEIGIRHAMLATQPRLILTLHNSANNVPSSHVDITLPIKYIYKFPSITGSSRKNPCSEYTLV